MNIYQRRDMYKQAIEDNSANFGPDDYRTQFVEFEYQDICARIRDMEGRGLMATPASPQTAADVQARRLDAEVRGHDRDENSAARQEANL